MAKQPKPTAKKAKEMSKTNFEVGTREKMRKDGPQSFKISNTVSLVKDKQGKKIVSETNSPKKTDSPRVNVTPQKGQERMKIKTYRDGKLEMVSKQGTDLLGRPFVKEKTTGQGGIFAKSKEKKTLTSKGVIIKKK